MWSWGCPAPRAGDSTHRRTPQPRIWAPFATAAASSSPAGTKARSCQGKLHLTAHHSVSSKERALLLLRPATTLPLSSVACELSNTPDLARTGRRKGGCERTQATGSPWGEVAACKTGLGLGTLNPIMDPDPASTQCQQLRSHSPQTQAPFRALQTEREALMVRQRTLRRRSTWESRFKPSQAGQSLQLALVL